MRHAVIVHPAQVLSDGEQYSALLVSRSNDADYTDYNLVVYRRRSPLIFFFLAFLNSTQRAIFDGPTLLNFLSQDGGSWLD